MAKTKLIGGFPFVLYTKEPLTPEEMLKKSREFYEWMNKRRTVRDFAPTPVPHEVMENLLMTASTAPSGAHKQPWTFCVVSDPEIKNRSGLQQNRKKWKVITTGCQRIG